MRTSTPGEKYTDSLSFHLARLRRGAVRAAMRPIYHWQPIDAPGDGYTVIIGCPMQMARVLFANLALVRQQRRPNLREILIAFDTTERQADHAVLAELERRFDALPLRFLFYSPWQARVLDAIGWAWCYCWLNWALPIGEVQTRYAIVHDLDALLLRDGVFEQRYHAIRERGDQYVGVNYYRGNGMTPDDRLAVTFEMAFDAADLRQRNHPIDLFNRVMRYQGRRVEFDTFLYPQRDRRRSLLPLASDEMVHPTQLVCQYVELHGRRRYVPPERNNLPMLAYFYYLAGDGDVLDAQRQAFDAAGSAVVGMLGREMDCRHFSPAHAAWLVTQIERVERAIAGEVREAVRGYLDSLQSFAAGVAAAGREGSDRSDVPAQVKASTRPGGAVMSDRARERPGAGSRFQQGVAAEMLRTNDEGHAK